MLIFQNISRCEGCGNHVGMGVRYNAEKKKVGMYYTTPIHQFRMKCHLVRRPIPIALVLKFIYVLILFFSATIIM